MTALANIISCNVLNMFRKCFLKICSWLVRTGQYSAETSHKKSASVFSLKGTLIALLHSGVCAVCKTVWLAWKTGLSLFYSHLYADRHSIDKGTLQSIKQLLPLEIKSLPTAAGSRCAGGVHPLAWQLLRLCLLHQKLTSWYVVWELKIRNWY